MRRFRKAALWVILPTVLIATGAVATTWSQPQLYSAVARIGGPTDVTSDAVIGEKQLVRAVARRVLADMQQAEPSSDARPLFDLSALAAGLGLRSASSQDGKANRDGTERLVVTSDSDGRVVAIGFVAEQAATASRTADAIAEAYVGMRQSVDRERAERAFVTLSAAIRAGREKLALARQAAGDAVVPAAPDQAELIARKAEQAEAVARAGLLRAMATADGPLDAGPLRDGMDGFGSLARLVEQRLTLRADLAREARETPRGRELASQLAELDRDVRAEAERLAVLFEGRARIAAREIERIEREKAETMVGRIAAADSARANVRELEQSLDRLESERLALSAVAAPEPRPRVEIVPIDPTPARGVSVAYAAGAVGLSLLLSAAFAFAPARLPRPVEHGPTALPLSLGRRQVYGRLPGNAGRPASSVGPSLLPEANASIIGRLAAELSGRAGEGQALRILVDGTGLCPRGDVALALGRALAASGRRPVLVEACEQQLGIVSEDSAGLAELLAQTASFADVIHRDPSSRLHYIAPGQDTPAAGESLRARLALVVDALALTYDFVILSGAAAGSLEATVPHMDAAIIVAEDGAAPSVIRAAEERIIASGLEDVVVLLAPAVLPGPMPRIAA